MPRLQAGLEPAGGRRAERPQTDSVAVSGCAVLSRFTVANGMEAEVKQAFRERPHLVDGAPGFLGMEVISPREGPAEIWLLTFWRDERSYRAWHRGHLYHESHRGIPKGLKLLRGGTSITVFDHVCS